MLDLGDASVEGWLRLRCAHKHVFVATIASANAFYERHSGCPLCCVQQICYAWAYGSVCTDVHFCADGAHIRDSLCGGRRDGKKSKINKLEQISERAFEQPHSAPEPPVLPLMSSPMTTMITTTLPSLLHRRRKWCCPDLARASERFPMKTRWRCNGRKGCIPINSRGPKKDNVSVQRSPFLPAVQAVTK